MFVNESTSVNVDANDQIFSSCIPTTPYWLFLHLCYTWFITTFFLLAPVMLFVLIGRCRWRHYLYVNRSLEELFLVEKDHSRVDDLRQYFIEEVRLTSMYLSTVVVFTLLFTDQAIGWLTILRSMIEASFVPFTFVNVALAIHLDVWNGSYLVDSESSVASRFRYMLKGTLFLWMRYTELYPSSPLNDYHTFFFYYYCDPSHFSRVPANHRLRRLLHRLSTLMLM